MINVRLELITTEKLQAIETTVDSEFLCIKSQNPISNPYLCILESDSPKTTKWITVLTVNEEIYHNMGELDFIGIFEKRGYPESFLVFELKDI